MEIVKILYKNTGIGKQLAAIHKLFQPTLIVVSYKYLILLAYIIQIKILRKTGI